MGGAAKQMDLIYLSLPSEGCDIFHDDDNDDDDENEDDAGHE